MVYTDISLLHCYTALSYHGVRCEYNDIYVSYTTYNRLLTMHGEGEQHQQQQQDILSTCLYVCVSSCNNRGYTVLLRCYGKHGISDEDAVVRHDWWTSCSSSGVLSHGLILSAVTTSLSSTFEDNEIYTTIPIELSELNVLSDDHLLGTCLLHETTGTTDGSMRFDMCTIESLLLQKLCGVVLLFEEVLFPLICYGVVIPVLIGNRSQCKKRICIDSLSEIMFGPRLKCFIGAKGLNDVKPKEDFTSTIAALRQLMVTSPSHHDATPDEKLRSAVVLRIGVSTDIVSAALVPRGIIVVTGNHGVGKTYTVNEALKPLRNHVGSIVRVSLIDVFCEVTERLAVDLDRSGGNDKPTKTVLSRSLSDSIYSARQQSPAIFVVDDLDVIGNTSISLTGPSTIITSLLMEHIEELINSGVVLIFIALTLKEMPLALQELVNEEISIELPDDSKRVAILQSMIPKTDVLCTTSSAVAVSRLTAGFVARDLRLLTWAATLSARKNSDKDAAVIPSEEDWKNALITMPFSLFGIPKMTDMYSTISSGGNGWRDVGGYEEEKTRANELVVQPMLHKSTFQRMGIGRPSGLLLYGPPGCGKTLFARALITECQPVALVEARASTLVSAFFGETERRLRSLFSQARSMVPCILLLDDIDVIGRKRQSDNNRDGTGHDARLLSQLLNEMDGISSSSDKGVFFLACTSCPPEQLDAALLRPGRLEGSICIDVPTFNNRLGIAALLISRLRIITDEVTPDWLAKLTHDMTGAGLESVLRIATLAAIRSAIDNRDIDLSKLSLTRYHVEMALL